MKGGEEQGDKGLKEESRSRKNGERNGRKGEEGREKEKKKKKKKPQAISIMKYGNEMETDTSNTPKVDR